jgi:Sporulation and spore germination
LLALAVAVGATAAGSPRGHVAIYFVQGEQVVRVMRPGASPTDAVEQLVAGPTAAEVKHGMRTYVPTRTHVRSVAVAHGLATVDLGARFTSGRDDMSLLARLFQLVRTLTGPEGVEEPRACRASRGTLGRVDQDAERLERARAFVRQRAAEVDDGIGLRRRTYKTFIDACEIPRGLVGNQPQAIVQRLTVEDRVAHR